MLCVALLALTLVSSALAADDLHYDAYLVLPDAAAAGLVAGMHNADIGAVDEESDLFVMAKYAPAPRWEVGGRLSGGYWRRGGDVFDGMSIGGKYLLRSENDALGANVLLPWGRADDWGLSLGYMRTHYWGKGFGLSGWGQAGVLDGYADGLLRADLLLQPYWTAGQRLLLFFDLRLAGASKGLGDSLALDVEPNADLMLGANAALNLGISLGIVGRGRQRDLGFTVALLWSR